MENSECTCKEDSIEKCDIFDFMAKYVGMSVLYPGGFVSTNRLLHSFNQETRPYLRRRQTLEILQATFGSIIPITTTHLRTRNNKE